MGDAGAGCALTGPCSDSFTLQLAIISKNSHWPIRCARKDAKFNALLADPLVVIQTLQPQLLANIRSQFRFLGFERDAAAVGEFHHRIKGSDNRRTVTRERIAQHKTFTDMLATRTEQGRMADGSVIAPVERRDTTRE